MEAFLAENAGTVVVVVVVAAFFIQFQRSLLGLKKDLSGAGEKREIANQPLLVALQREFVAHEDFRREIGRIDTEVKNVGEKIEKVHTALAAEGSKRAASIHMRVDKVAEGQATVAAKQEQSYASLVLLGQKVDALIMELRRDKR